MKALFLFFVFSYSCIQAQNIFVNEVQSKNAKTLMDGFGEYHDWIELYNSSDTSVNLLGYFLSDDEENKSKWEFPNVEIAPYGFLVVFASGEEGSSDLHASFKIGSDGESIYFSGPDLQVIDFSMVSSLQSDRSYARTVDGEGVWACMYKPSPGISNAASKEEIKTVDLSHDAGFYSEEFYLKSRKDVEIRYTLNGEVPTEGSALFPDSLFLVRNDSPMQIAHIPTSTTVQEEGEPYDMLAWRDTKAYFARAQILKLRVFEEGGPVSDPMVYSYFIGEFDFDSPVISLVSDSIGLFSYEQGVYVPGIDYDPEVLYTGNYNRRGSASERAASIHYFNEQLDLQFKQNLGIRIFGGGSRLHAQKSFRLTADKDYSIANRFNYPFFKDLELVEFKHLILRSKFTHWWDKNSMFQDEFVHRLVKKGGLSLDVQADQETVVYLNGEYWGVHTLRQRLDENYIESKYGFDKDGVDIINGNYGLVDEGTSEGYEELEDFILTANPNGSDYLDIIGEQIDLENYIDYFIVETYFGNLDWPQNNMKMWRAADDPNKKWRFFLYDLDAAFHSSDFNTFKRLKELDNPQAKIFIHLLASEEFRDQFLSRYNYLLNNIFLSWDMVNIVDELSQSYSSLINDHIGRWGNPRSKTFWQADVDFMRRFLEERSCIVRDQLVDYFGEQSLVMSCLKTGGSHFVFFPNPSDEQITIQLLDGFVGESQVSIYDMRGRLIKKFPLYYGGGIIDVSAIQKGLYTLLISSHNGRESSKLLAVK